MPCFDSWMLGWHASGDPILMESSPKKMTYHIFWLTVGLKQVGNNDSVFAQDLVFHITRQLVHLNVRWAVRKEGSWIWSCSRNWWGAHGARHDTVISWHTDISFTRCKAACNRNAWRVWRDQMWLSIASVFTFWTSSWRKLCMLSIKKFRNS